LTKSKLILSHDLPTIPLRRQRAHYDAVTSQLNAIKFSLGTRLQSGHDFSGAHELQESLTTGPRLATNELGRPSPIKLRMSPTSKYLKSGQIVGNRVLCLRITKLFPRLADTLLRL
ncbi:hypothetical protein DPMN_033765, partial [Dreissena polymorpha]